MSMNKYMHPRNIYKSPPNFRQLAIEFPEFRKHVKQDIAGKIILDFKDLNALRALSCTLLKKDFGLNVNIPVNKLIPTIPLRLNYLLWIEDLLEISCRRENIKGIDIGTGASCVYPLIAAKKFGWFMIGSETDKESVQCALDNVRSNGLEMFIKVLEVTGESVLEEAVDRYPDQYDFCMCNPPFFSSPQELHPFFKSRKAGRPYPRNAFVATVGEVVSEGGEVKFISKIIKESKKLQNQVRIFTSMVGHKSSIPALKKLLREEEVRSFKETEFCQGHTTRWGLAWTFCDIDLRKIPLSVASESYKKKIKPPLLHIINKAENAEVSLSIVVECIKKILTDLQINFEVCKKVKSYESYIFTAVSNTWSHQRRKTREKKRQEKCFHDCEEQYNMGLKEINDACDGVQGMVSCKECVETTQDDCESHKRSSEDELPSVSFKKLKLEDQNSNVSVFVKGIIVIRGDKSGMFMEMNNIEETTNREHLHQIFQYIKNNLRFE